MSSSPPATVKCRGSTSGARAGTRLLTASIPNLSVDASQSCHSALSSAASHGWISMSVSFIRRRVGGDQPAGGPDARSEPGQAGEKVVGGGVQLFAGHRVKGVEDEQRRAGVLAQLGAAGLAPVPVPAGNP